VKAGLRRRNMDQSALTVNIERTGETQQLVKGEVAWPEVKTKMDQAFKELSREVRLKGFRRGKVPRGLLDKMLGGKVREEVAKNLVNEALADIISTHRLRVVAPPSEWDITNWGIKTEEPLRFEARMEVLPQVEPQDYFGFR
jgi:trigger factor